MSTVPGDESFSTQDMENNVVAGHEVGGESVNIESQEELVDVDLASVESGAASQGLDSAIEDSIAVSPEVIERDETISRLERQLAEATDRHLRLLADFDNFKKNGAKQRAELLKYQGQAIITELLTVLDTFEYALAAAEGAETSSFRDGVVMIQKNFLDVLERWGIKGESAVGKPFDPVVHAALSTVESPEYAPGTVAVEYKKAFFYKDKLLRPAEVVVVKESAQNPDVHPDSDQS